MKLEQLTDRIFYYPHQPETDRPMLAYINGSRISLAIDAGNSAAHVDGFYGALEAAGLKLPDMTVITHWHWDHTFGMHHIHGLSAAHVKTNEMLKQERIRLADSAYADALKEEDPCLKQEYADGREIVAMPSDIAFTDKMTLKLGGLTADIFHAVSPHSEDAVLVYVPEEKVLFLGDSTCGDFYNGGYMDKGRLKTLVRTIERMDCRYCILSHAGPLTKKELLDYLGLVMAGDEGHGQQEKPDATETLLYKVAYLVEVEDREISTNHDKEELRKMVWKALPDQDIAIDDVHTAEWYSTQELLLDSGTMNCGRCHKCNAWTTDREKPDPVRELTNGAVVDGELLCDDCLPKGHPWAF